MERFSEEELQGFAETFRQFDESKDGLICVRELGRGLQACGQNPSRREVEAMIAEVDRDENGKLEFNEFIELMMKNYRPQSEQEEQMIEAFKMFDRNGDGLIEAKELQWVMQNCGDDRMTRDEAQEMINSADMDGDGCINYEEFTRMLLSGCIQLDVQYQ